VFHFNFLIIRYGWWPDDNERVFLKKVKNSKLIPPANLKMSPPDLAMDYENISIYLLIAKASSSVPSGPSLDKLYDILPKPLILACITTDRIDYLSGIGR
jgi:hypothetical protein